jgi:hypothetical protein
MERLGSDGRPVRPGPPLSSLAREVSETELVDAWGCRWVRREGVPYYEVTDPPLRHATLEDLDEPALVQILTEPKNALVKQYQRLFEMEDVKLTITMDALKAISRRAIERKTGARGLRSIMEQILLDLMFELPALKGVEEVVIGPEVVDGAAKPLRIYSERLDEKGSTAS